jgi:RHS repeat-associated protein
MSMDSFEGSQAFNRISNVQEDVIPNSGSLILGIPLVNLTGTRKEMGLSIQLTYLMGKPGRLGLPDNWSFGVPFLIPDESLEINGTRYIIDPDWQDATGYASGLKYENNHGIKFTDNIISQSLPYGDYGVSYQYVFSNQNGANYYFDSSGNLLMHADRFGNYIYYAYTSSNYLDYIIDSFGQKTSFAYPASQITITCADGRATTLNYSATGVSSLVDPMDNTTYFSNITQGNFSVVDKIDYPSGKITSINYTSLEFYDSNQTSLSLPAVSDLYHMDQSGNVLAHYQYAYGSNSGGNSFTGYSGGYSLSSSSDGLLDSNNTLYIYDVQVRNLNASGKIIAMSDNFYNFAHVPIKQQTQIIDADGTNQGFVQVNSTYDISADKHNQQPNYLSPKETEKLYYASPKASGSPQTKLTYEYDDFGNTTSKVSSSYKSLTSAYSTDVSEQATYFTQDGMKLFTLQASSQKEDFTTNQIVKTANTLTSNSLEIASNAISYSDDGGTTWNDWKTRSLTYDAQGRETSDALKWSKANAPGVQETLRNFAYAYDASAFTITTTITNALGLASKQVLSTMYGKKTAEVLPSQATTSYTYDKLGRLVSQTLPSGQKTSYSYKNYSTDGENSTTTTNAVGYQTTSIFDALGRETSTTDNGDPVTPGTPRTLSKKEYDMLGNLITETDIYGNKTTSSYNSLNKATASTDPFGNQTVVVFDFTANTSTTSINGIQHKKVTHDQYGRKTTVEKYPNSKNLDPDSQYTVKRVSTYSGFGNLLTQTSSRVDGTQDAELFSNTYQYDIESKVISDQFSAPDGSTKNKQYVYDLNQKEISYAKSVTYPDKRSYQVQSEVREFNAVGQMVKLTNNASQSETYSYTGDGQMAQKTLFDGTSINYEYNADGLKTKDSWQEQGSPCAITYSYDAVGRLVSTSDKNGTVANSYSLDNLLIGITYPDGKKVTYTLDKYSRKVKQQDASGFETSYSYTAQNQLESVSNAHDTLSYEYYKDASANIRFGAPKSIALANNFKETYQYDAHNHLNRTQKLSTSGEVLLNESSVFNPLSQVTSTTTSSKLSKDVSLNQQRSFTYDAFKQLIEDKVENSSGGAVSDTTFQYDGNNNVLQKTVAGVTTTFSYNSIDQLVSYTQGSDQPQKQSFDQNGCLTTDGEGNSYSYDARGKLLSVKGTSTTQYSYYPNDLLAQRIGEQSSMTMYYDNVQQVINSYQNDAATQFLLVGSKRYAAYNPGNDPYYYGMNQHQDTVMGLSASGKLKGETDYQAYGEQDSGKLNLDAQNNFAWNQEYKDVDNNLIYLRARFYDPKTMQFITRDTSPVNNRYAYCNGDPINNIDPSGHDTARNVEMGVGIGVGAIAAGAVIYGVVVYGPAIVAALGGISAVASIGAGAMATAGAVALGAGAGGAAIAAAATTGVAATVTGAPIGAAVGATLGTGLGAYMGGTTGAAIGGSIGAYVGTAAGNALGLGEVTVASAASSLAEATTSVATTTMATLSNATATATTALTSVTETATTAVTAVTDTAVTTMTAVADTAATATAAITEASMAAVTTAVTAVSDAAAAAAATAAATAAAAGEAAAGIGEALAFLPLLFA